MAKHLTLVALAGLVRLATADAPFTCSKALPGPPESTCTKSGFLSGEDGKLFAVEQLILKNARPTVTETKTVIPSRIEIPRPDDASCMA